MSEFTFAGVSRRNGELKLRFANDASRVKVLARNGHTDIDLVQLPYAMDKNTAVQFLNSMNFGATNQSVQALISEFLSQGTVSEPKVREPKQPKVREPKQPKVREPEQTKVREPKPAKPKITKAEILAQLAKFEDALM